MQSSGYQTDDDRPKSLPHTQDSGRSSREVKSEHDWESIPRLNRTFLLFQKNLRKRYLSDQYRFQYLHKVNVNQRKSVDSNLLLIGWRT